jgi:O-antigen/teichoic acid export membrane protein
MSAASRVVVAVTGAIATVVVARMLGPSGAGGYAVAQSLIALLAVATTLGVEHGIAYYVSSGRWAARSARRAAQRVALVSGVVGAGLGVLARLIVPSAFGGLSVATTAVAAAALPFVLSWFYFTYIALAIDRYEAYALAPATQSVVALVLIAVLGALFGLSGVVVAVTLGHVAAALAVAVIARRTFSRRGVEDAEPPAEPGALRRAIRFGIKGYASNALQFVNYRLDVFILAGVASAAAVGRYAVAISITSIVLLLPRALADVLFPRVAALSARADGSGEEARARVETKSLRHLVVVVLASSAVVALVLLVLVVPVYGAAFRPAVELGLILLPGTALVGLSGMLASSIVGRGHPGGSLVITAVTTPVTIALYAVLIPPFHAVGAALASSVSYGLAFVLSVMVYRHVGGERVLSRLMPTRSELEDYRAIAATIVRWLRNRRVRRPAPEL